MSSGNSSVMEESQEVKRKRISRACHMCQKKKIRCDGNLPACTHCMTHNTDCVFTQLPKRRGSRKGAKYIEALEKRLGKMETLLSSSGLMAGEEAIRGDSGLPDQQMGDLSNETITVDAQTTSPANSGREVQTNQNARADMHGSSPSNNSERSTAMDQERDRDEESCPSEKEPNITGNFMYSLGSNQNQTGETRSVMSSTGFSIFSPKGIQWVIEKTGNTTFKDTMYAAALDENKPDYWKSEAFSHIFSRPIFRPLPPKEEAFLAVKEFFKDFNSVCPLFSQPTFMDFLERQYTQDPPNSVGWWASLNIVLAITYCLQSLNNAPPEVNEKAWDYFRNALAVLTELTIRSSDLFGVQALLGMALFMQGTADPRPSAFLVASAMRLSHTLGLHKKESGFNLEPMEAEQRKRIFWIAYRIDKDMCIRSGLPLIQDDDDMNLELPDEDPEDGFGNMMHSGGQGKINIFRLMAEFALIEARVHKQLYSTKASKQSDQELLITIGELDRQLEEWKEGIPIDFQPEYEIRVEHPPLSLHIIVLHFAYYNCLTMIHRTSVNHSYWTSRSSNAIFHGLEPLNPRVFASATLCSSAARASIRLIKYIPIQDMGFVWRVLYYPVSALITLFANILENPTDPRTRSDLRLMNSFGEFLSQLLHEPTGELKRIYRVCLEFEIIAKDVVERTKGVRSRNDSKSVPSIGDMGRRSSGYRSGQPLTPESNFIGSSGMPYSSPTIYNNGAAQANGVVSQMDDLEIQNFASTLNGPSLGSNQFAQQYQGLLGGTLNPYLEIQPMFPNGLTMPWNGNTFHGPFPPDSFSSSAYDFRALG